MLSTYAKNLRKNSTEAENKLWRFLRARRFHGYKFRRQYSIAGKYIVDFVCLEIKLIIELDGSQHLENIDYDLKRTENLIKLNFKVLRYWNNDVLNKTSSVLTDIYNHI